MTATGRAARRSGGEVVAAARQALDDVATDHAAAALLGAIVLRLAQDVDDAVDVRDRVAATRGILDVLRELDTAVVPPKGARAVAPPAAAGGVDDDDADDPFGIGDGPGPAPASLGDTSAS